MEDIMVTLLCDGRWTSDNKFTAKASHGMLVSMDASYNDLLCEVRSVLGISETVEVTCIAYQIDKAFPPTKVDSDHSLRFYLNIKSRDKADFSAYPLCVQTRKERSDVEMVLDSHLQEKNRALVSDFDLNAQGKEVYASMELQCAEGRGMNDGIYEDTNEGNRSLLSWVADGVESNVDGMDSTLRLNGIYPTKEHLKETLQLYAIFNKFQFETRTSTPGVLHVVCNGETCKWAVRGVRISGSQCFEVRRFDSVHSCSIDCRMSGNRQASATIIGKLIKHQYMDASGKPYPPKSIISDLNRAFGLNLSYKKAWRGKERALLSLTGTDSESYKKLPMLCYLMDKTNPRSLICLDTDENGHFKRMFMSLGASREGWAACRPVISVDGAHLKAKFRGTVLSACAMDANRQIFPLAFGFCDSENKETWSWFFTKLREAIGEREDMCIVSDRNEGLIKGVKEIYAGVDHGHCVQHILGNIISKFGGGKDRVTRFFNAAARAATERKMEYFLRLLDAEDHRIRNYLAEIGLEKWARCKIKRRRYSIVTSNNAETLNSVDGIAREYPIAMLVEFLRTKMQVWFHDRSKAAREHKGKLSAAAEEVLGNLLSDSAGMIVRPSTAFSFEVIDKNCRAYEVNLETRSCSCKEFELEDFVCVH
ncbi:unnamed protein product, partial [Cuscuta europaea]